MRFFEGAKERKSEGEKSLSVRVKFRRNLVSRTFERPILYPGPEYSGEELVSVVRLGLCDSVEQLYETVKDKGQRIKDKVCARSPAMPRGV